MLRPAEEYWTKSRGVGSGRREGFARFKRALTEAAIEDDSLDIEQARLGAPGPTCLTRARRRDGPSAR